MLLSSPLLSCTLILVKEQMTDKGDAFGSTVAIYFTFSLHAPFHSTLSVT